MNPKAPISATSLPKSSIPILIREARPEDAAALIAHFRQIFAEPGINLITEADEFSPPVESESRVIRQMASSPNSLFLVAEIDDRIVGQLTLEGGKRRNVQHTAVLGITVANGWRGRGVGHRLIDYAIRWARES
ncbi:MAG TPA: GNAT family N-acetyltransferase, partial [Promineifilum sp.]|nr:GNAT family N-acetyltransferase [Promineifilum sp.]